MAAKSPVNCRPDAVILPARSHPEVTIYCVAARDRNRADIYARKHNIPVVHDTYSGMLHVNVPSLVHAKSRQMS